MWTSKCSFIIVFETNSCGLVDGNLQLFKIILFNWGTFYITLPTKSILLVKNAKLKWLMIQNVCKIAKCKCRENCKPQNREIKVSRKFHVIRYLFIAKLYKIQLCVWNSVIKSVSVISTATRSRRWSFFLKSGTDKLKPQNSWWRCVTRIYKSRPNFKSKHATPVFRSGL